MQLGIDGRNKGITKKKEDRKRSEAKCSHSFVPGQCKHERVGKEREQEALAAGHPPIDSNVQMSPRVNRHDSNETVETRGSKLSQQTARPPIQPCIFEMNEKTFADGANIKIHKYTSIENFNQFSFKVENIGSLYGCFDRDNTLGQIKLSSFSIGIKSLVSDYSYKKNMKLDQWMDICGYMKKKVSEDTVNPSQLVAKIT